VQSAAQLDELRLGHSIMHVL